MEQVKAFLYKIFHEYKCYVTFFLIVINVLIFVGMFLESGQLEFDAMYVYEKGGMVSQYLEDGQYYRLFMAMFLHFSFEHIVSNMLMLGVLGSIEEQVMGSGVFAAVYILGGLIGNIFSGYMHGVNGDGAVAAGASGAVFAISGALIYLVLVNRKNMEKATVQRMAAFVVLMVYQCFGNEGVDNYAHLGGLVSGFVIAAILLTIKSNLRKNSTW